MEKYLRIKFLKHRIKSLIIFLSCFFLLTGAAYSQQNKKGNITLNIENQSIRNITRAIEKQTEYRFFYSDELKDLDKTISIRCQDESIENILKQIFRSTDLIYKINDNRVISIAPKVNNQKTEPQNTISGSVVDEKGEPLIGVTILIKGSSAGTMTDINGLFTIENVKPSATLVFTYVGYEPIEQPVGNKQNFHIILKEKLRELGEVVVVGYGSQRKVNLSGAVSMVTVDEQLAGRSITSTSTALNGLVPGLMVQQSTGMAGKDGATLRIRGLGTVNSGSPLIVVDGMPDIDLDRIDMNDIENISVLKDASSSAVYGSRAANGVVLITTKKGRSGKVNVNYSGNFSIGKATDFYEFLADYPRALTLHNQAATNGNSGAIYKDGTIDEWMAKGMVDPLMYPNTDWWDVIFRTPFTQSHNLSATGGNDNGSYYLSVGILDQEGLMINNDFNRYSFRANLDQKINKYIKVGLNATGQWSDQKYPLDEGLLSYGKTTTWDMVRAVAGILPQHPVTGEYGGAMAYNEDLLASNLLATYSVHNNKLERKDFNGMGFFEWQPLSFLQFRADYGLTYRNDFTKSWSMPTTLQNFQTGQPGYETVTKSTGITDYTRERTKTILNAHAIYNEEIFKGHDLRFQFIYSEEYWHERSQGSSRNDRFHPNLTEIDGAGVTTQSASGSSSKEGLRSIVTKLNYDINDKYMLQALVRWDASSKFSKGHQWGTFPSVSAAWRFSEEPFFENLRKTVDNAKIRLSWGKVGNNSGVDRYYQKDTYSSYPYTFGDNVLVEGYAPYKLIDPNFTWESTEMTNLGFEFAFLNNRLRTEMDLFNKLTTNMIRPGQKSRLLSGFEAPDRNIGEMRNRGFEITLGWQDQIADFSYGINLNYAYTKNKLLQWNERLGRGDKFIGYPYEMVYAYKAVGIAQSWEEIANAPYHNDNLAPGDLIMEDINGDGVIDTNDRIAYPNAMRYIPTSDFSLKLNAEWKGFDLSALFQGNAGRKNFWIDNFNNVNIYASRYSFQEHHLDTWSIENRNAKYPRLTTGSNGGYNQAQSTFWLYSCDYIRLKNLQIGYRIPKSILKHIGVQSARIHLSGENLFTITKWPGLDPEKLPKSGSEIPYPLVRTYTLGINITL